MFDVLTDWLGSGGKTVDKEVAERRAEVCADCPLNVEPNWIEKFSKDPIASVISKTLELKHNLHIGVEREKDLFLCKACGCSCRLKIWVPLEHIIRHTAPDTMASFQSNCWILKEKNHEF